MEQQDLRVNFIGESVSRRLGNLASTLHRLADFVEMQRPRESILLLIDEAERFVQWTQPDLDPDRAGAMEQLLVGLVTWRRCFQLSDSYPREAVEIEGEARTWAATVVEISGLTTES